VQHVKPGRNTGLTNSFTHSRGLRVLDCVELGLFGHFWSIFVFISIVEEHYLDMVDTERRGVENEVDRLQTVVVELLT